MTVKKEKIQQNKDQIILRANLSPIKPSGNMAHSHIHSAIYSGGKVDESINNTGKAAKMCIWKVCERRKK